MMMTAIDPHKILMKFKSKAQKRNRIDELIDIILAKKLPEYEIEELKEEAVILAESLLRCSTKKQEDSDIE